MPNIGAISAGFGAAAERQRTEAQSQLLQVQALGEQSLIQGRADEHEKYVAARQAQLELDRFAQEAAAQGRLLTAEDFLAQKDRKAPSMAEPLEQLVAYGVAKKKPATMYAAAAKQAADIRQDEAAALSSTATAQEKQWKIAEGRADLLGSVAAAALAEPGNYQRILLAAAENGMPVDEFPKTFNAEALRAFRDISKEKKAELERLRVEAAARSTAGLQAAQTAAARANTETAKARKDLIVARKDAILKDGGKDTPEALEVKRATAAQKRAVIAAKERQEFPPIPAVAGDRYFGQTYTAPNGTRVVWEKDPNSFFGGGRARVLPKEAKPLLTVAEDATKEDTADEEELDYDALLD
jgi:hypothetical protein